MAKRSKPAAEKAIGSKLSQGIATLAHEAAEFLPLTKDTCAEYEIPPHLLKPLQAKARDVVRRADELRAADDSVDGEILLQAILNFGASHQHLVESYYKARNEFARAWVSKNRPKLARDGKRVKAAERQAEALKLADKLTAEQPTIKREKLAEKVAGRLPPKFQLSPSRIEELLAEHRPKRRKRRAK